MIQRIQTLYLLVALVLVVVVNFFPLVTISGSGVSCVVSSMGVTGFDGTTFWTWGLVVISSLIALMTAFAIISFSNRRRQMSLCVYSILAVLAFYVCLGAQVWTIHSAHPSAELLPDFAGQLPLVSIIFFILAGRAIKRDEALVRSMDRIR